MSDDAVRVAARERVIDELHHAAVRAFGADITGLDRDEYIARLLIVAVERIVADGTRGYMRRKPAQPAALDITKLQIGLE